MHPDQTTTKGAVWGGFKVFAPVINFEVHLNVCIRRKKQMTFEDKKKLQDHQDYFYHGKQGM